MIYNEDTKYLTISRTDLIDTRNGQLFSRLMHVLSDSF